MPNYALAAMAQGAAAFHADLLYADEDHLDDAGHRTAPVFKPAWSPELLRSTPYLGAPLLVRRELLVSLGAVDGLDSITAYTVLRWRSLAGPIASFTFP